jgi:chloramphenicol 3-O-phosphotransferase
MGTLLDSFSKSTVEAALHSSEVLLLLSGLVLLVGIWGEYRKGEKWKKYLVVFQVMVLAGIGVELLADAGVFLFSESLQRLEGADIQALDKKALEAADRAVDALGKSKVALDRSETADSTSRGAMDKSGKAERSSLSALDLAKGARLEADSFEKDIVLAKRQAADAESHLEEALRRAADATAELNRLKSPRSLTNVSELVDTLRQFNGTEFMFLSVFADDESINLLKQLDSMLGLAGWKRLKHSEMKIGIPAIRISGPDDLVDTDVSTAVHVEVDSSETVEALQAQPRDKWPAHLRIAVLLNELIFSHLSPPEVLKPENRVGIDPGSAKVIRIRVGKKP